MIRANFKAYSNYITDSLYQWDKNQPLNIYGLNLAVAPELHFSNANMEKAIPRQATLEGGVVKAQIPNSLLQYALDIKVHIGIYEGETFKVIEKLEIPVIPKARPLDYVFEDTDGEIYSYNKIEKDVDTTIEKYNQVMTDYIDLRSDYDEVINHVNNIEYDLSNVSKVITGTYTGDGNASQFIDLGFTPSAVIVMNRYGMVSHYVTTNYGTHPSYGGIALTNYPCVHPKKGVSGTNGTVLEVIESGFNVFYETVETGDYDLGIYTNQLSQVFYYVAYK